MILDIVKSSGVEVVVSYSPVWELCFSLHVLSQPEHHLYREKWARKTETAHPELTGASGIWVKRPSSGPFSIDSPAWSSLRQMEPAGILRLPAKAEHLPVEPAAGLLWNFHGYSGAGCGAPNPSGLL